MPIGSATATSATYKPLAIVLVAVVVGIGADRYEWPVLPSAFGAWWLLAAGAWTGWLVCHLLHYRIVPQALLLLSLAAAGGAWHHARWNLFADDELGRFASVDQQPVCLEAVAIGAPQAIPAPPPDPLRIIPLQAQSRLKIEACAIRQGRAWRTASGTAQLTIDGQFSEIRAGDRLRVFGQLSAPAPADNPGEFDFASYARGHRQLASVRAKFAECVETVSHGSRLSPAYWISDLRQRGNTLIWEQLSRDQIGLASAILLGERELVDRDLNDAFLQTGTIHILSISGLHVGILAMLLFLVLRSGLMSRRAALLGVVAITGLYMLLTNCEPPVMRATLLVWIVCGATWLGRPALGLNSLALAALVVLAVNPCGLFNSGVQLSFLSVAVLMKIAQRAVERRPIDPLDRLIAATRPWPERMVRHLGGRTADLFMVGLALWLVITPITMLRFHLVSPSALLLNVFLTPFVTFSLAGGFGVLLFGWLVPPLGAVCGWVCNASLWMLEQSVRVAADLPGSYFWTPAPSATLLTLLYLAVAGVLWLRPVAIPLRWRTSLAGAWCGAVLLATLPAARPADTLRCTFISVGHGCSVLLELPDGKNLLYDAGRLGSPQAATRSISAVLWERGIRHIDALVLSHADLDHYNAVPALAQRFGIGVVYVSPTMFGEESPALNVLRDSLKQAGIPIEYAFAGDKLRTGDDARIDVLHPPSTGVVGTDNANSIVLAVERAGRRILITGDLEAAGLDGLLRELPYDVDILLAPHHGSTHSDPDGLVRWCTPEVVVISGGRNDQSPSVRQTYESHGAKVYHTAQVGAVSIELASSDIELETHRPPASTTSRLSRQASGQARQR